MNALYYAAAAAYWHFIPQLSGNFPRNYSGKVPLFFRKNSGIITRKFPEISELTTLVLTTARGLTIPNLLQRWNVWNANLVWSSLARNKKKRKLVCKKLTVYKNVYRELFSPTTFAVMNLRCCMFVRLIPVKFYLSFVDVAGLWSSV